MSGRIARPFTRVEATNVKLRAAVDPARRELEILKQEIGHGEDSIAEITEKIRFAIANTELRAGRELLARNNGS